MDAPSRPQHRRNASSKSILKSFVSAKSRPSSPNPDMDASKRDGVLGERQHNAQSPPSLPAKKKDTGMKQGKQSKNVDACKQDKDSKVAPQSKSSTNIVAAFGKKNRSSKDLTMQTSKDKENTRPSIPNTPIETPIWAQFSSQPRTDLMTSGSHGITSSVNVQDEIARYTPQVYSPSKQRNFNGTADDPTLRPTLNKDRPHSSYVYSTDNLLNAIGRRVSGRTSTEDRRRSEELKKKEMPGQSDRVSTERSRILQRNSTDRKTSGSSADLALKEKLNVTKRGRVMAAVAAFQSTTQDQPTDAKKEDSKLDPQAVDAAFEAVLESRNIPEPMREKMRAVTLRVKADFIKTNTAGAASLEPSGDASRPQTNATNPSSEDDVKSPKQSRARSRTFTFSRTDKKSKSDSCSPSKKSRPHSRSRPISLDLAAASTDDSSPSAPSTPTSSLLGRTPSNPQDYITYLRSHPDPLRVEVGRLHKLRILLRNETVAWVEAFVSLSGLQEIVALLHRLMALEWREDHEDQLLHESLLCLKGLCTTARALAELDTVADDLFPALLRMLFDPERKGPAEYATRTIIIHILFTFLSSSSSASPTRILSFLRDPSPPASSLDFVSSMHLSRPFKAWSRELSSVTKEVFWIFLHPLNVIPLPQQHQQEDSPILSSYRQRHFPAPRPPVPAAPYVGGVEWDATQYLAAHLDLMNGAIASLASREERNALRAELRASGFERTMGSALRTCKEKFYRGVHAALKGWVGAAAEDGWAVKDVREGFGEEEGSPKKKKGEGKGSGPPKLDAENATSAGIGLDLGSLHLGEGKAGDEGWLG